MPQCALVDAQGSGDLGPVRPTPTLGPQLPVDRLDLPPCLDQVWPSRATWAAPSATDPALSKRHLMGQIPELREIGPARQAVPIDAACGWCELARSAVRERDQRRGFEELPFRLLAVPRKGPTQDIVGENIRPRDVPLPDEQYQAVALPADGVDTGTSAAISLPERPSSGISSQSNWSRAAWSPRKRAPSGVSGSGGTYLMGAMAVTPAPSRSTATSCAMATRTAVAMSRAGASRSSGQAAKTLDFSAPLGRTELRPRNRGPPGPAHRGLPARAGRAVRGNGGGARGRPG